jgi:hypothetical protein
LSIATTHEENHVACATILAQLSLLNAKRD